MESISSIRLRVRYEELRKKEIRMKERQREERLSFIDICINKYTKVTFSYNYF